MTANWSVGVFVRRVRKSLKAVGKYIAFVANYKILVFTEIVSGNSRDLLAQRHLAKSPVW